MRSWLKVIGCLWLITFSLPARAAGPHGVDVGWTVDHTSGQLYFTTALANQLSQGEVGWVRVEVALVKGHTNWDATMFGYYDTVVNNAHAAGLQVLMLIDSGSWPGSQTDWCASNSENNPGANGDNAYFENYATNAVVPIVQHFRDRVKIYELWNEPNCWTSNPSNGVYTGATYIYPSNFGWLLTRSWEAIHGVNHFNDVTLFSGGLFGLSAYGSSYSAAGGQYLDDTYNAGTNLNKGGSFAHTKSLYNAYPLDGIGQHIYITQGGLVSSNSFRQYEDWVHQALTKYEGASSPKKTFITEFGWQTTNSSNGNGVSAPVQDTNLVVAFSAIQATPYVQTAIWFNWEDNPAGKLWYGVLDSSGNPKASYHDFQLAERFEGTFSNNTTNAAIQTYFSHLGQSLLGSPLDSGHGPRVYSFLNGYAQDYFGGSHSNLTLIATTNGTFELNNLYGLWSYYTNNNGTTNFGPPSDNAFASGGGVKQDFSLGYLTWDSTNQVLWHSFLPLAPTSLTATPDNGQISLQWDAVPTATSYKVYTATTNIGPFALNTTVVGPPNFTDAPLNNGAPYFYEVSVVNSYGEGPVSAPVNATPEAIVGNLPSPWQDTEVGSVNLAGSAGYSAGNGQFSVRGCGAEIGASSDAFHVVYQPVNGDAGIIARVKSLPGSDGWSKAGVMIRETLATNAAFAMTCLTPSNGVQTVYRTNTGANAATIAGLSGRAPYWVKLTRLGSNFISAVSADGSNYVQAGTIGFAMKTNACFGLAVCSHNTNILNASIFDDVIVTLLSVRPSLGITPNGILSWSGAYTLQQATNVLGPYQDMIGVTSPFTNSRSGPPQLFYRLKY